MKPILPDTYTATDFTDGTGPFEQVYAVKNPFQQQRELEKMTRIAAGCGIRNFKTLYAAYVTSIRQQSKELLIDNATNFDKQPLELNAGNWRAGECGVFTDGPYGEIEACNHPILPVMRLVNIDTGIEKLRIAYRKGKLWRSVIMDKGTLASANKILELANVGVSVTSENSKYLVRYLYDLEALNYDIIPEFNSVSRMGWIGAHGFSPYVDELVFDGDANFKTFFESVKTHGNMEKWRDMATIVRKKSIYARVILAASFASVLVGPLGGLPFFVHLWGGTEAGKTVGLMLAASVWANPEIGRFIHTFNSTAVGREKSAAFVNSLPLILDELQIVKDKKEFDKDIYMLSEGAGRTRGNKSGGVDTTPTWANCILTSGEMPITGAGSGGGAVNRIVEIECKERLFDAPRVIADTVRKNYGFAGKMFVEQLKDAANLEQAANLFASFSAILGESDTTEKQAMAAALILTADTLATAWIFKDDCALTVPEISEFLRTRASVSAGGRGYEYLCESISQNANKFKEFDQPLTDVWGKLEDGEVSIIKRVFDDLCTQGGFNAPSLLSWMKQEGKLQSADKRLTRTVRINNIPTRCVTFQMPQMEENSDGMMNYIPE
ncbi:MAG: DUF927 domain-containing protein [Ruthenibacterium sp.]